MKKLQDNLRAGVIGVGSMGRHHVRIVSQTPGVTFVGFHEPDLERAKEYCSIYGCTAFETVDELLDHVDAVSIAAPTSLHHEIGKVCMARGVHVLVEKPLAHNLDAARQLVEAAAEGDVTLMVGHVERYNPAVQQLMEMLAQEREEIVSIDTRRLAPFDGTRCLDVDVLYDLLIHDVDLALEIAGSPVRRVSASGRSVFSQQIDVVHATLEFENKACAALCAGKCSAKKVRNITVSTPRRYLEVDTLCNSLTVHTAEEVPIPDQTICLMGNIRCEDAPVPHYEPLRAELDDFFRSVRHASRPVVDGERALRGMEILELIKRSVEEKQDLLIP
jgi:predicted dehydrogenase